MAGVGKTYLTGTFREWLRLKKSNVLALNLDPGAAALTYNPDVDIRSMVNINQIMKDYQLGPNGALIMATDLIADHLEEVKLIIEDSLPDILLVDTPGQIELFAFRECGPFIVKNISAEPKAVLYLLDAPFSKNPRNFISNMFLAAAVYNRLLEPQIYALSKSDLIDENCLDNIITWTRDFDSLTDALNKEFPVHSVMMREVAEAIEKIGLINEPIPISSKDMRGFIDLLASISRILTKGEDNLL
jgi:GTPase SAR1 family protein